MPDLQTMPATATKSNVPKNRGGKSGVNQKIVCQALPDINFNTLLPFFKKPANINIQSICNFI